MGALGKILQEQVGSDAPAWVLAGIGIVFVVAHYGPKWYDVIEKNKQATNRILQDDKRKNEKHALDIREKLLKIEERELKAKAKKQGAKP